jgi:hypothetical protein
MDSRFSNSFRIIDDFIKRKDSFNINKDLNNIIVKKALLDNDTERIKSGYTSLRWDITNNYNTFFQLSSLNIIIERLLYQQFRKKFISHESMIHLFPSNSKSGINWHTERMTTSLPNEIFCAVIVYVKESKIPLEIKQSDNEYHNVFPKEGRVVILGPDIIHRVPESIVNEDRISIVIRFH